MHDQKLIISELIMINFLRSKFLRKIRSHINWLIKHYPKKSGLLKDVEEEREAQVLSDTGYNLFQQEMIAELEHLDEYIDDISGFYPETEETIKITTYEELLNKVNNVDDMSYPLVYDSNLTNYDFSEVSNIEELDKISRYVQLETRRGQSQRGFDIVNVESYIALEYARLFPSSGLDIVVILNKK